MVGILIYLLLARNKVSVAIRKGILLSIVVCSFALPYLIENLYTTTGTYEPCLQEHQISEAVYLSYCPSNGDEVKMCYDIVKESAFCSCDVEEVAENLLVFKGNIIYDFLVFIEPYVFQIAAMCIFLTIVLLVLRLFYLAYIIKSSRHESYLFRGKQYTVLHPKRPIGVSSFRLRKSYIIWQEEMNYLTPSEQEAILWHEISHIQQRDTWLKIALNLTQVVWILNPVFYYINREIDRLNEFLADEFAVNKAGVDVRDYASLLVKMKRYQHLSVSQAFNAKGELKRRIVYLLKEHNTPSTPPRRVLAICLPFLMVVSLSTMTFYSMPAITEQLDTIKLHQTLTTAIADHNGQKVFCKNCFVAKYGQR